MHFANARFGLLGDCYGCVWRTSDSGSSWSARTPNNSTSITSIYCIDSSTAIITGQNGIRRTTNQSDTLSIVYNNAGVWILDVAFSTAAYGFAVGRAGMVLRTTDAGLTWTKTINDIGANLTDVAFTSNSNGMVVASDSSIYSTTDGGYVWTRRTAPTVFNHIYCLDALNGFATGFKDRDFSSVWRTTDSGQNWEFLFNNSTWFTQLQGIGFWNAMQGCIIGSYTGSVGHYGNVEHYTTNGGSSWNNGTLDIFDWGFPQMYALSLTDSLTAFAIHFRTDINNTPCWYIVRTTDAGLTWALRNTDSLPQGNAIHFVDRMTGLFVGNAGTILRSDDGGLTWAQQQSPTTANLVCVFLSSRSIGVAAGDNGTILTTTDGGSNWISEVQLTTRAIRRLLVFQDGSVVAIGDAGTIIRGRISPTDVENHSSNVPSSAFLEQNFPNPFNPSTKIRFRIGKLSIVTIKVLDLLGKEVAILNHGKLYPGNYERSFDGSGLASGVYFYRLQTESFTETKKFILLK
jgi:photosystem II stability/assembly factor-like uncharacterized protein